MGTSAERVINIGARERRKRLTVGIVALCVGVIIAVLLVGMALTKASLVALYFMHLKFERRVLTMIAFTPLLLCVFLALMLMPDSKLALGGRTSGAAGTPAGEAAGAGSPDSKEAPAAPGATPGSAAPAEGEHQH